MSNPMDFVRDFLKYYDKTGIYDHFDKESQKMTTSPGVLALVQEARSYLPKELKPKEAAVAMRELPDEMRNKLIAEADDKRVVDLRTAFARRMSKNKGAQGLLADILKATEEGDVKAFEQALRDAAGIVKDPTDVYDTVEQASGMSEEVPAT